MIKKIVLCTIFMLAIGIGLGTGYGITRIAQITYAQVAAYVSELKTDLTFKPNTNIISELGLGGPHSQIESTFNKETINQYIKNFIIKDENKTPKVSSLSYLVADLETGKIILSQNINQQLPIASVTKLMTAVVADEFLGLDMSTTITQQAIDTYGTQGDLKKGEKYTIRELFYPLLLESSNDAAEALAYTQDRNAFIKAMNNKAKNIGLLNTQFEDASGLSAKNTSTVTDLFRLTQYISKYRSYIFDITTEQSKDLNKKTWHNNSRFRNDREYVGGKNGYIDEAKKTHVVLFNENFGSEKRTIVYIILRSEDVAYDVNLLRDFVYKNIEYK